MGNLIVQTQDLQGLPIPLKESGKYKGSIGYSIKACKTENIENQKGKSIVFFESTTYISFSSSNTRFYESQIPISPI